MKPLQGKTALVTGVGRRIGIGFAVCELLAQSGVNVFFTYWNQYDRFIGLEGSQEDPKEFQKHFAQFGTKIACAEIDLSQPEGPQKLFSNVIKTLGVPDILINNACYSTTQPLSLVDAALLDAHYVINVRATTLLCKYFFEAFDSDEGSIVNLTSGQSLGVMENELPYTITKASVDMLGIQLAPQLSTKNIKINAFEPGPTDTGWMSESLKETLRVESPTGHVLTPHDAAMTIFKILTGENETITGDVIHTQR